MAGGATEGADDGVLAKVFPGAAHRAGTVGQVDAVEAVAVDEQEVVFDDDGDVAGMGDQTAGIGGAGDAVFIPGGERKTQAGDLDRVHHGGKLVGKGLQIKDGRGDQGDLGAVGGGHLWLHQGSLLALT